jgi:hypothetical protein
MGAGRYFLCLRVCFIEYEVYYGKGSCSEALPPGRAFLMGLWPAEGITLIIKKGVFNRQSVGKLN